MPAPKPASYPFMAIANKFGVDYGLILAVADYNKPERGMSMLSRRLKDRLEAVLDPQQAVRCFVEIVNASIEQDQIRSGEIDWQTGEPIPYHVRDGKLVDPARSHQCERYPSHQCTCPKGEPLCLKPEHAAIYHGDIDGDSSL